MLESVVKPEAVIELVLLRSRLLFVQFVVVELALVPALQLVLGVGDVAAGRPPDVDAGLVLFFGVMELGWINETKRSTVRFCCQNVDFAWVWGSDRNSSSRFLL